MPIYASSEKTYEALLQAAGELAAENGFANVSTRAVAVKAGANVSSIHYHFGSKDGLFEALARRVLERMAKCSIADIVAGLESELDTPEGQARALREIVRNKLGTLFNEDYPRWQSRVIYQLMQYENPLREMLFQEMLERDNAAFFTLLRRVRPELALEQMALHYAMILAPILFHSDYMAPILRTLGRECYDADYLEQLEDFIVLQALRALGLPLDALDARDAV